MNTLKKIIGLMLFLFGVLLFLTSLGLFSSYRTDSNLLDSAVGTLIMMLPMVSGIILFYGSAKKHIYLSLLLMAMFILFIFTTA